MAYHFYFDGLEAPITPGSVKFSTSGNNKTYTLIDEGEINVLKLPSLQEITFDLLLPTQEYPFANTSDLDPSAWIDLLKGYMESRQPFQFVITRTTDTGGTFYGTSLRCSVQDFSPEEDADSYGVDTKVSVTLKEYKDYGTKTVVLQKKREQDKAPETPATVDADKADNPVATSKKYTNTSGNASTISKSNGYGKTTTTGTVKKAYDPLEMEHQGTTLNKKVVTVPSTTTKKTASDFLAAAKAKAEQKTGKTWSQVTTRKTASDLLSSAIEKAGGAPKSTKKTAADLLASAKSK